MTFSLFHPNMRLPFRDIGDCCDKQRYVELNMIDAQSRFVKATWLWLSYTQKRRRGGQNGRQRL
jgi:hypothetical protein